MKKYIIGLAILCGIVLGPGLSYAQTTDAARIALIQSLLAQIRQLQEQLSLMVNQQQSGGQVSNENNSGVSATNPIITITSPVNGASYTRWDSVEIQFTVSGNLPDSVRRTGLRIQHKSTNSSDWISENGPRADGVYRLELREPAGSFDVRMCLPATTAVTNCSAPKTITVTPHTSELRITSLTPTSGRPGDRIRVAGQNIATDTKVEVRTSEARFNVFYFTETTLQRDAVGYYFTLPSRWEHSDCPNCGFGQGQPEIPELRTGTYYVQLSNSPQTAASNSVPITITVSSTPANAITIISPSDSQQYRAGDQVQFAWETTGNRSDLPVMVQRRSANALNSNWWTYKNVDAGINQTTGFYTTEFMVGDVHEVRICQQTSSTFVCSQPRRINVVSSAVQPPPVTQTIQLTSPADNAEFIQGTTVNVVWTGTGVASAVAQHRVRGTTTWTNGSQPSAQTSIPLSTAVTPVGTYINVRVCAVRNGSVDTSTCSADRTLRVIGETPIVQPTTRARSVDSYAVNINSTNDGTLTFYWSRPDSVTTDYDVYYTDNPNHTWQQARSASANLTVGSDKGGRVALTGLNRGGVYYLFIVSVADRNNSALNSAPTRVAGQAGSPITATQTTSSTQTGTAQTSTATTGQTGTASATASIYVLDPAGAKGGQDIAAGSTFVIRWNASGVNFIQPSLCDYAGHCLSLGGGIPGSGLTASAGAYQWYLDPNHPLFPGNNLRIKLVSAENSSIVAYSGYFDVTSTQASAKPLTNNNMASVLSAIEEILKSLMLQVGR